MLPTPPPGGFTARDLPRLIEAVDARFERFGKTFHESLRQAFLDIARKAPERCVVVDATLSEDDVAAHIWKIVAERFGLP